MPTQTPSYPDYTRAIAAVVDTLSPERKAQIFEYALFLRSRPASDHELQAVIEADEAWWDAQFASTDDAKLAALVAEVEADIRNNNVMPMFDEAGEFIER
ncbi:MAG: hypothetical protein K1X65_15055 [Caldilineales bacterium]|nr:hypothetical protein [Caldilineales bacterium]MCW5857949.1 hypothetical protein [Caldilineales bacterium]